MRRDAVYGTSLIIGALAGLITMAFHPTGHQLVADFGRTAPLNAAVHTLALVSVAISFFGALGLTRRLTSDNDIATAALVAYGFGALAAMCAAVASGLIAPNLVAGMLRGNEADRQVFQALFHYNGHVNQAFAKVFVVASCVAIVLWSIAILVNRKLARGAGFLGCFVGGLLVVELLSGHLRLDVHGFGLVMLGQGAWLALVGALLIRAPTLPSRTSAVSVDS